MIATADPVAPRWPMKLTRYSCASRGCGAAVTLTIIDPLPRGWRVIPRPKAGSANWAGGVMQIAEGKVGYACPDCARKEDDHD